MITAMVRRLIACSTPGRVALNLPSPARHSAWCC
jgi:hypothetical protein